MVGCFSSTEAVMMMMMMTVVAYDVVEHTRDCD